MQLSGTQMAILMDEKLAHLMVIGKVEGKELRL